MNLTYTVMKINKCPRGRIKHAPGHRGSTTSRCGHILASSSATKPAGLTEPLPFHILITQLPWLRLAALHPSLKAQVAIRARDQPRSWPTFLCNSTPNTHQASGRTWADCSPIMATATPKTMASLPLYTVVALFGFLTELFMKLLGNVAGRHLFCPGALVIRG